MAASGGVSKKHQGNYALRSPLLFGYIRALFRSG